MKAEEIRKVNSSGQQQAMDSKKGEAGKAACLRSLELSTLAEIAAQLAEVNESLKCIAHKPECLSEARRKRLNELIVLAAMEPEMTLKDARVYADESMAAYEEGKCS